MTKGLEIKKILRVEKFKGEENIKVKNYLRG